MNDVSTIDRRYVEDNFLNVKVHGVPFSNKKWITFNMRGEWFSRDVYSDESGQWILFSGEVYYFKRKVL